MCTMYADRRSGTNPCRATAYAALQHACCNARWQQSLHCSRSISALDAAQRKHSTPKQSFSLSTSRTCSLGTSKPEYIMCARRLVYVACQHVGVHRHSSTVPALGKLACEDGPNAQSLTQSHVQPIFPGMFGWVCHKCCAYGSAWWFAPTDYGYSCLLCAVVQG